jgi:lysophosphatidate acyltransferase
VFKGPPKMDTHHILYITAQILTLLGKGLMIYSSTIFLFAIPATVQEYKIWKHTPTPLTLWGLVKVYLFNIIWMGLSLTGAVLLLPIWASRGFGNSVQLEAHCVMERLTAMALTSFMIGSVEIRGEEKLPWTKEDEGTDSVAPIYIANHGSQIDVGVVYFAIPHFKWIAKKSVQYIPGPGPLMSLSGHVFIQRTGKNSKSVHNLYDQSYRAIRRGIPLFLFPQGTRRITERLPFKDGAFNMALETQSNIVPISIEVPMGTWNHLFPISRLWGDKGDTIILTVHDSIPVTKDMNKEDLKQKCTETIYSVLPPSYTGNSEKIKTS